MRILYFDNMRVVLMLSVILLHVAAVFSINEYWNVIRSNNHSILATLIFLFTNSFVIPSFFVISGYFFFNSLKKYNTKTVISKKIYRIVVPLIVVAISFNSIQEWILIEFNYINNFNLSNYIINGEWKHHLWFLINLIIFYILAICFKKHIFRLSNYINSLKNIDILLILFILPTISILLLILGRVYPIRGIINSSEVLYYLPFFIFGLILKENIELLKKFENVATFTSLLIAIAGNYILNLYYNKANSYIEMSVFIYIELLVKWFSTALFFKISKNFLNKKIKNFDFLSEASYNMYLTHHLWVIVFAIILIKLNINGTIGVIVLSILTIQTTLFIYKYIILKNNILYYLLNGIKKESYSKKYMANKAV